MKKSVIFSPLKETYPIRWPCSELQQNMKTLNCTNKPLLLLIDKLLLLIMFGIYFLLLIVFDSLLFAWNVYTWFKVTDSAIWSLFPFSNLCTPIYKQKSISTFSTLGPSMHVIVGPILILHTFVSICYNNSDGVFLIQKGITPLVQEPFLKVVTNTFLLVSFIQALLYWT